MKIQHIYPAGFCKCVLLFTLIISRISLSAQQLDCNSLSGAFTDEIIAGNITVKTQVYKTAPAYDGTETRLYADIYRPVVNWTNQQLQQRPLVILLHGGGLKSGSRQTGAVKAMAAYYAQRGYVAASADYRLGWDRSDVTVLCGGGTLSDYLDAQYRAMQDERSLVQYLKSQYANIGFDTNRIFLMGISSGATIAVSRLETSWISADDNRQERLGPLEVFEGNRKYLTDVAGIISVAGANLTPQVADDYRTPVAFFHGTCDNAVPYQEYHLAGCTNMGYYYGPGALKPQLEAHGVCHQYYVYCGYGHDFLSREDTGNDLGFGFKSILRQSIDFMLQVMCSQCKDVFKRPAEQMMVTPMADCNRIDALEICGDILPPEINRVEVAPNLLADDNKIYVRASLEREEAVTLQIFALSGQKIQEEQLVIPQGTSRQMLEVRTLPKGVYIYHIIQGKKRWASGKLWKL